ncbi:MAG: sulfatase [Phycisphaerae bacterium]|jgi:arylsulfatase A-like enzyme
MNVILYAMDSLRADHVHTFGYPRSTTPVIDRVADEGAAFSQCYAQCGWTAPSGASLLSGVYPSATGIHMMRDPLEPSIPWLPEILKARGYQTVGFSAVYQVSKLRGFERGFDAFHDLFKDEQTIRRCQERDIDARGDDYCLPLSEDIHVPALQWLDESREKRRPFFMLLWSIDTHEPFRQPSRYNVDVDPDYRGSIDGRGRPYRWVRNRRDLRQIIDLYDGSIRYQDEKLGELLAELDRRGVLDDTLIVLLGDHGEMFFEHGVAGHGKFPWEEMMRVPLIMRGPSAVPAAVRSDAMVQTIDIAPTVLDLIGVGPEPAFRGKSLKPLIKHPASELHESIVLEIPFPLDRDEGAQVVREGPWKYVEHHPPPFGKRARKFFKEFSRFLSVLARPGAFGLLYGHHVRKGASGFLATLLWHPFRFLIGCPTRCLFDLDADPGETRNRLGDHPDVAARLRERLSLIEAPPEPPAVPQELEDKVVKHLEALGYIE